MAIGDEIKKINKRTKGQLLTQYPNIDWEECTDTRNFIAHEYFRVDTRIIFDTVKNDVPLLLTTVQQIIADLKE